MRFIGLLGVAFLFFIWPIPHTISIRDFLLLSLLGGFGYLAYRSRPSVAWLRDLRAPLSLYFILTLWIFIVAIVISQETAWSLNEIRGQWIKSAAALIAGMLLALSVRPGTSEAKLALKMIILGLLVHIIYLDAAALWTLIRDGFLPRRISGLTEGPDRLNYLSNILFAFVMAEILYQIRHRKGYLLSGRIWPYALLVFVLFSIYIVQMRNGIIPLAIMSIVFIALYYRQHHALLKVPNRAAIQLTVVMGCVLFAYASTASDVRWRDFLDTVPVALDTRTHKAWLDWDKYPRPALPDGRPVKQSNYLRIAWLKEGSLLVQEHPLGVGFGRNAFEIGLRQKYGEGRGYSHSGILDMAIGIGVPGAMLWLGFLGSLCYVAWRTFENSGNYHSLLMMFLIADFGSRMFVDSIIRDHMLQQFLFLVGLASVLMRLNGRGVSVQEVTRS